jgi:2-succinyl-5-enolpyruvyl-6-hydroxy-3-cyclohexene-1-carboxylate synthase
MNTSKKGVRLIAEICRQKGIRHVVFSPGSRSAPLVIAFSAIQEIECIVIPDERVAGYFALGMAQQLKRPVAVVCTSGTAVLNLGPAVAEAFYQYIPLLLLTADRPEGAVAKGENQAIDQSFIFEKITQGSFDINADEESTDGLKAIATDTHVAIEKTQNNGCGPVHVNIRLKEPLYNLIEDDNQPVSMDLFPAFSPPISSARGIQLFQQHLSRAKKKLIVVGLRQADKHFSEKLHLIARRQDTAILVETASNLSGENFIYNYDACLEMINGNALPEFIPDVVITLGNQVISKRIRGFLRKHQPAFHWDISPENVLRGHDLFDVGPQPYLITEQDALDAVLEADNPKEAGYAMEWKRLHGKMANDSFRFGEKTGYSDFKAMQILAWSFPEGSNIHYANSSPIRYSNFFQHDASLSINSNRGVSGIDGCVSTAAGAAWVNKKLTICVTGDIGFFYDSNALFNNNLSPNLRIIIINNSGGNIFRLIDGPGRVNDFEKFFETKHNLNAKHLALMYGLPYYFCDNLEGLGATIDEFYKPQNGKAAILEIRTDNLVSEQVFKAYFGYLKQHKQQ